MYDIYIQTRKASLDEQLKQPNPTINTDKGYGSDTAITSGSTLLGISQFNDPYVRVDTYSQDSDSDSGYPNQNKSKLKQMRRNILKTKRIRKRQQPYDTNAKKMRVVAYCISNELKIEELAEWLSNLPNRRGPSNIHSLSDPLDIKYLLNTSGNILLWEDRTYMGIVHSLTVRPSDDEDHSLEQKDLFWFPFGCIVFWNFTVAEELDLIISVKNKPFDFVREPVTNSELRKSIEDMTYSYGDESYIGHDHVVLNSQNSYEKLSLSFALAQSAKLWVFEDQVDKTIASTETIPEELSRTGTIQFSQRQVAQLIGKVFSQRAQINLSSDILDTPEFFWEEDRWQEMYKKLCGYLEFSNRLTILNKRLDILKELLDVLNNQMTNSHATKLELIVIALIVIEVVIQLVWNVLIKDIFGFIPRNMIEPN